MSAPSAGPLFEPIRVGAREVPNRIVMAPMTRRRSGADGVPTRLNARYYAQRATTGLIITEAAVVTPSGGGVPGSPGMYTDAQQAGWATVAEAVHAAGGAVFLQLWHAGRVSHPAWIGGETPLAPSPVAAPGVLPAEPGGAYPVPRAMTRDEIGSVVEAFAMAGERARRAGFDGVEVHAAQGYLIDQFLRASANRRDDDHGGPPENRARLLLEVVEALSAVWSSDRIGVQLSPVSSLNGMSDPDPLGLFAAVSELLAAKGLAYLHVHEPLGPSNQPRVTPAIRARFHGPLVVNGGYDGERAAAAIGRGEADLVSFGRPFISNPDLPRRIRLGAPLRTPDPSTFYGGGAKGYTDYPVWRG